MPKFNSVTVAASNPALAANIQQWYQDLANAINRGNAAAITTLIGAPPGATSLHDFLNNAKITAVSKGINKDGLTPLNLAMMSQNKPAVISALIGATNTGRPGITDAQREALCQKQDSDGNLPIHILAMEGDRNTAQNLHLYYSDNADEPWTDSTSQNNEGKTPADLVAPVARLEALMNGNNIGFVDDKQKALFEKLLTSLKCMADIITENKNQADEEDDEPRKDKINALEKSTNELANDLISWLDPRNQNKPTNTDLIKRLNQYDNEISDNVGALRKAGPLFKCFLGLFCVAACLLIPALGIGAIGAVASSSINFSFFAEYTIGSIFSALMSSLGSIGTGSLFSSGISAISSASSTIGTAITGGSVTTEAIVGSVATFAGTGITACAAWKGGKAINNYYDGKTQTPTVSLENNGKTSEVNGVEMANVLSNDFEASAKSVQKKQMFKVK